MFTPLNFKTYIHTLKKMSSQNISYQIKYNPDMSTSIEEDVDNIISGVKSRQEEVYEKALVNFLVKNEAQFSFPHLNTGERRQLLWKALESIVEKSTNVNVLSDVFTIIRIISREKCCLDDLVTENWLLLIGQHIGLNDPTFKYDNEKLHKLLEAEKALCNILFNSKVAVTLSSKNCILSGILNRVKQYGKTFVPDEIKYFDMKILFLISALCPEIRYKLKEELEGLKYLIQTLQIVLKESHECSDSDIPPTALSDEKTNVACETLKALFNITLNVSDDEDDIKTYMELVSLLRHYLLASAINIDKTWQLRNDVVNLLTNMPAECYSALIIPIDKSITLPKSLTFEGQNMIVIYEILMLLQAKFNDKMTVSKQQEVFSPVITFLLKGAMAHRVVRKFLRMHILPPLKDIKTRPEEGDTLRNHLCKLLTTPITQLRDMVAELLFVLCKKNVTRMIKYTGYGNAAGLFAQRGLLGGKRDEGEAEFSSGDEDSDTEEYMEHKHGINPVTGKYEEPHPDPMANMSEEQKEYEAMKLVQLMDNLAKAGTIKPCRIGPDGTPQPIEHILQLQEGLRSSQINKYESDSD